MPLHKKATSPTALHLPTTRYQGSKRRAASWIQSTIEELDFVSVLDAFGGTGIFSYFCKQMGKQVTYNDILKFNSIIGRAIIENDYVTLSDSDIKTFTDISTKKRDARFVERTFKNIYFTAKENRWLDNALLIIKKMQKSSWCQEYKIDLLYYCIIQSCLCKRPFNLFHRRNLQLRLSTVHRTFGNKTTWDRSFGETFERFAGEVNSLIIKGGRSCTAINNDVLAIDDTKFDLVYVDPPYLLQSGKNETADYMQNYHFLEGLVRPRDWPHLIDFESANLRFLSQDDNPWIDAKRNSKAFDLLFEKFRNSTLVISHKKHGVPSLETIRRKLTRLGKRVWCRSKHYSYALSRQNGSEKYNREFLIIAE